jgi:hypothetical protein
VIGPSGSTLSFPGVEGPTSVMGTLPRLTAEIVKIQVIGDMGPTVVTAGQPEGLGYRVYVNGDAECAKVDDARPEYERTFPSLAAGSTLYVVLANTLHATGARVEYTLEVNPVP